MKLYIDGPDDRGDGVYHLVAETGEHLASHYCSNYGFARYDLEERRTESKAEWKQRFGEYEVVWLGSDDVTADELMARNRALVEDEDAHHQRGAAGEGR